MKPTKVVIHRHADTGEIWIRFRSPSLDIGLLSASYLADTAVPGHRWMRSVVRRAHEESGRKSNVMMVLRHTRPGQHEEATDALLEGLVREALEDAVNAT